MDNLEIYFGIWKLLNVEVNKFDYILPIVGAIVRAIRKSEKLHSL